MSDRSRAPCVAQLRAWAADPLQDQCWGLAELADEIERMEHEIQSLTGYPPHFPEECAVCLRTKQQNGKGNS